MILLVRFLLILSVIIYSLYFVYRQTSSLSGVLHEIPRSFFGLFVSVCAASIANRYENIAFSSIDRGAALLAQNNIKECGISAPKPIGRYVRMVPAREFVHRERSVLNQVHADDVDTLVCSYACVYTFRSR